MSLSQSRKWAARSFFALKLHQVVGPTLTTPPIFTTRGVFSIILRRPVMRFHFCEAQRPHAGRLGKQNFAARASRRAMETPRLRHSMF
jgi:hypothetical protein